MSRQNSLLSTSPLISTDFDEGLATASRHDSMNSMQGLEIAELKREVARLASSEAQAKQSCNQISQELQICNADLAKKRTEIFEFADKLSKQSRILKDFENKTIKLREDTKRQVREIQDELDREKQKLIKSNQNIAELRTEVDAKDTRIEELEARLSSTENPPDDAYCEVETTAPLTDAHHEAGCEEYQQLVFQQLGDAQALQTAAEAEVEGLRHLEKANADLTDGHAFDSELIKEMAKEEERYRLEAQQLEDTVGELRVKQHLASETFQEIEPANPVIQPLGFSAVAHLCTTPIAPEDTKAEISEYMHRSRAAELEVESLNSEKHSLLVEHARLGALEHEPKSALKLSGDSGLASEPDLAPSSKPSLRFSDMQLSSTTPHTPVEASASVINPALLSQLEDLGTSIMSLSTAPPPKTVIDSSSRMQLTSSLPNVALTINIKPTDKRKYSLLQRVQGAISATSKLDIHGPKEIVKQFVASMNDVEKDHAEKSQLRADIEVLEARLRNKVKCSDPTHRRLADELEAKTAQFTMQEQLLAHWQIR